MINNIIPNTQASEYEKMFFKTQSEAIAYYQKCLQEERNILTVNKKTGLLKSPANVNHCLVIIV